MVVLNYLLVITWFPLIVLVWSNHFEGRKIKNMFGLLNEQEDIELHQIDEHAEEVSEPAQTKLCFCIPTDKPHHGCFCIPLEKPFLSPPDPDGIVGKLLYHEENDENFSKNIFAEDLNAFRPLERFFYSWYTPILNKIKYFVLFFFFALIVATVTGASMLAPAREPFRFLPRGHPTQVAFDFINNDFGATDAFVNRSFSFSFFFFVFFNSYLSKLFI